MNKFVFLLMLVYVCLLTTGCLPGYSDYSYNLINGYILARSSNHEIMIVPEDGWQSDEQIIPAKVVEVAWNDRYVIAKQYGLKLKNDYNTYEIPDRSKEYYWILDTEQQRKYGPYNKKEFNNELKRYNLENLKLKKVEYYRNK